MHDKLTIASVYHSLESKKLLLLNFDLVKKLNPKSAFEWIVADNTPAGFEDKINNKQFSVLSGIKIPENIPKWLRGSFQHSWAVNDSIKHVKTRFALFLDIDFYVLKQNWIEKIIAYMKQNSLWILGAPWHPQHTIKPRYFPAIHCLFVDFSKVDKNGLDFSPEYDFWKKDREQPWSEKIIKKIIKISPFFGERMQIGQSKDTAYKIHKRYYFNPRAKFECFKPVFNPTEEGISPLLESFLPDRFSKVPKRKDYFSEKGFRELGYFGVRQYGWEEFLWQGEPLGFHIRGSHKLKDDFENKIDVIKKCLASFNINLL